jgi:hypothetical protein
MGEQRGALEDGYESDIERDEADEAAEVERAALEDLDDAQMRMDMEAVRQVSHAFGNQQLLALVNFDASKTVFTSVTASVLYLLLLGLVAVKAYFFGLMHSKFTPSVTCFSCGIST